MKKITVDILINETIHYASQQNCIPIIQSLVVTNQSSQTFNDISVKISFDPEFAVPYETSLDYLNPSQAVELAPIRIIPSMEYLVSLMTKKEGTLTVQVKNGQDEVCVKKYPVQILAYDEWTGIETMPEMICAYVTPLQPTIHEVIEQATSYLKQWGTATTFTGYALKNPEVVREQMKAIFKALQDLDIEMIVPVYSYETVGQKLRLPQSVVEERLATPLELSLLYSSCLEAVGLNPILVFLRGHAFPGCWLEEETFAETVEEDATLLTKCLVEGAEKIALVDSTDYVMEHLVEFRQAGIDAKEHLTRTDLFTLLVDIKRCRKEGIHPLPMRIYENGQYIAVNTANKKDKDLSEENFEGNYEFPTQEEGDIGLSKQKLWERKLLDLSLRNTLLNFRKSKTTVQLMAANLFELEDEIARGEQFTIMARPKDLDGIMGDTNLFTIDKDREFIEAIASSEFTHRRIRTFVDEQELEEILKNIHRKARILIEENGANSLFLALGFLRWYETDESQKARYAPLVLVPVDIVRRIQSHSYVIRIRDEEMQVNVTLLEMLRQDFGIEISGLDPIPMDESGVDLTLVFREIRKGIAHKKNWKVEEYAFLGLFSFHQFIMWNDIRNRAEELKQNKIVASLLSGKMEWEPQADMITARQYDEKVSPMDLAIPISADSSQLETICAASKGQSFVLHGPPGTGKSQTITNMIADALYHGKSVLFVAEKMEALSVVQKRLDALGIGPFCLELHSNKAQKREVLEQLNEVLQVAKSNTSGEFAQTATQLHSIRMELNQVMKAIHKKREYGVSLYEAIGRFETYKEYKDLITIEESSIAYMKEGTYEKWLEAMKHCVSAGIECGGIANSVFRNYHNSEYSLEIREEFAKACKEYSEELKQMQLLSMQMRDKLGVSISQTYAGYQSLAHLLSTFVEAHYQLDSLMLEPVNDRKEKTLYDVIQCGKELVALEKEIATVFDCEIYEYDVFHAVAEWKNASSRWFMLRIPKQLRLLKEIRSYALQLNTIDKHSIVFWYTKLQRYLELQQYIQQLDPTIISSYSYLWQGLHTNWDTLEAAFKDTISLRSAVLALNLERDAMITVTQRLGELVALHGHKREQLVNEVCEYLTSWRKCMTFEVHLEHSFKANLYCFHKEVNWIDRTRSELEIWLEHIGDLRDWSTLLQQIEQLNSLGLTTVTTQYLTGNVKEENLVESFICNCNLAIIKRIMKAEPILASFQGVLFEETIKKYHEVTAQFEALMKEELIARLSAKIPSLSMTGTASSELGILQKAIRSGGRMVSIRKLFDQTQNLLRRICPCMLMSPMSVAQYLDPAMHKFDLVIFDEASQLPTCEAVGAIARGENAVIVGDPMQLPPTRFFTSNNFDEENYEMEDLESVLDDCLALSMPQKYLLWHYRSQHESLIAYSNARYYKNKLHTFPSPNDMVSQVKWVHVEGYYDKGVTKQNKAEANAIVSQVCKRLLDEQNKESIGIVTFSSIQQNLIEDLLEKEFQKTPRLEEINNHRKEPIFVKNLENVQGDERDVIFFSVGYGPDKEGKVSMNFGPLNQEGGFRRLNVAITRARKEMQVYSTITPEQIDLTRTRSEGAAGLKGFLQYARQGKAALTLHKSEVIHKDSILVEHIAKEIAKLGYETQCNIGCSEYTVDIGIVNPNDKDSFLLGILLDGENSVEAATARERNLLQPMFLQKLGWKLHAIWILDWLDNPEKVLLKVKNAIEKALADGQQAGLNMEIELTENTDITLTKNTDITPSQETQKEIAATSGGITPKLTVIGGRRVGTQEEFYNPKSDELISSLIIDIINEEAPISKKLLYKKLLACFGISRWGARVDNRLATLLQGLKKSHKFHKTVVNDMIYYWRADQDPDSYQEYRVNDKEEERRGLEDIPPYEIANAMREIIASQVSLSKSDMLKETARVFGFNRIGTVMENVVNVGLKEAEKRGFLIFDPISERIMVRD